MSPGCEFSHLAATLVFSHSLPAPMSKTNSNSPADSVAIATVVTFGALKEFELLRYSFELFHPDGVKWFIRCDAQSEPVLRALPNTFCVHSLGETAKKLTPEDRSFDTVVAQKMAAMDDAWQSGACTMVIFMDADLVITGPLLSLLSQTAGDVLLTPHYFVAQRRQYEESRYGRFNSGFVAARNRVFHSWWLSAYHSQPEKFTDQQCLDDVDRHFQVALLPESANVGSWRGPLGTEGLPEVDIPADCMFLHVHFLQPGDKAETLAQKCFAVEYFQYSNLLSGIQQRPGTVFSPREIVQKAFALRCLEFLKRGIRAEHRLIFEEILRRDDLKLYEKALSREGSSAEVPLTRVPGSGESPAQKPGAQSLPEGDYVSPGLKIVRPDAHFPYLGIADKSIVRWEHFRRDIPHNFWSDRRYPDCGFLNRDEAQILYNSALQFRGRRGLEIGCWMGWSACHIALAGVLLDVIDPLLEEKVFRDSVLFSLRSAGLLKRIELFVGKSPELVEELAIKEGRRWSFLFIDGSHTAPDPLNDARIAVQFAEPDALVLFHDVVSPEVAEGLDFMRESGWNTMIYQTTQIMGVAWRGNVEPVRHIPDPKVAWTVPDHLSGYTVSGKDNPQRKEPVLSGRFHRIDQFSLEIPRDHILPVFQQQHQLYDRFLPFVVAMAPQNSWIIDVGANVGDTVASVVAKTKASILAIEGHDAYFTYLLHNVSKMPSDIRERIRCARVLAGSGELSGTLVAENGTAKIKESATPANAQRVDDILKEYVIQGRDVFLLKTDTDGYDADVLRSAARLLKENSPILYFENQVEASAQVTEYEALYRLLAQSGYRHYWVFDNFGNLVLEGVGVDSLPSLNRYLLVQQQKRSTRTFYYCDVLATKPQQRDLACQAVNAYKQFVSPEPPAHAEKLISAAGLA
jgi:FkbM family methyltransferase